MTSLDVFVLEFVQQLSPPTLIWKCGCSQTDSSHGIVRPTSKLACYFDESLRPFINSLSAKLFHCFTHSFRCFIVA